MRWTVRGHREQAASWEGDRDGPSGSAKDEGLHRDRVMLRARPYLAADPGPPASADRRGHRSAFLGAPGEAAHQAVKADQRGPLLADPFRRLTGPRARVAPTVESGRVAAASSGGMGVPGAGERRVQRGDGGPLLGLL